MIVTLSYSVQFPSTGRCFQNQIELEPGLTAITGPNEAGKSLIIEMITYAHFGKSALRGSASDYRNLDVRLEEKVKGQTWVIQRSGRNESFTVDGELVAVGAEALNKEIPARLGFGLDVWNVSCVAPQDELLGFTKMRPAQRKQMVDRLIGIDQLETVERDCKQEMKTRQQLIGMLSNNLVEPTQPEMPENYQSTVELESQLEALNQIQAERMNLLGLRKPEKPVKPEGDYDLPELERLHNLYKELQSLPVPKLTEEELLWAEESERRGPQPRYSYTEEQMMNQLLPDVSCPKCGFERVKEDIPLSNVEVEAELLRIKQWGKSLPGTQPTQHYSLSQERRANSSRLRLAELKDTPAVTADVVQVARNHEVQVSIYKDRMARYDQDLALYLEAQEKLNSLPDQSETLVVLRNVLARSRAYDAAFIGYESKLSDYQSRLKEISEKREEVTGFERGSRALKNARATVKRELVPSLSKAASALLQTMTNGQRQNIYVDEDFNINVDGQPVNTLSGSGKAVVNLALRIGLGKVLTSRVMSVFMGDEIDASMDAVRAGATAETMNRLKDHLGQIILVTHKQIEADHKIEL